MANITRTSTLYYIHDPMCSWCWGFRNTWLKVAGQLKKKVQVRYILGGLAPDTDEPMPEELQTNIQNTWHRIQQEIPGTAFNYEFWNQCSPRRSTYPSCRAIIAATKQDPSAGNKMLYAIQQAYYLNAQNPSDESTLISLAKKLGLDEEKFKNELTSADTHKQLLAEFELRRKLKVNSFPSLVLETDDTDTLLDLDYNNADMILEQINQLLADD